MERWVFDCESTGPRPDTTSSGEETTKGPQKSQKEIQKKIERGEKSGIINNDNSANNDLDLRQGAENYSIEFESQKITK